MPLVFAGMAAFVLAFVLVMRFLVHAPDEPNERIFSAKDPRMVADCIASAYHGVSRQLDRRVYLYEVRNGRNALQMRFLVAGTAKGTVVQVWKGWLYGLSDRWRPCL